MHKIGVNYDHYLAIVKGNQGHPGRAARIRARRDREDLRPRVRFRGFAQVRVRNPLEITPREKRETELNPRRGSARLRANRFAPLQTVDRPKPGKLRDQDGWQAGCARKRVLPSRFLIGLSRASDETRRKGLLNPSTPQLLIGLLARRGRLARHSPRRRPSEFAPLGLFDPSAGLECGQWRTARQEGPEEVLHGQDEDAVAQEALLPAVEQDRYPFVVNENPPSLMADLLRFRQMEWRISGHARSRGRLARRPQRRRPSALAPLGPSFLRRQGRDLLSCRRFVLLSTGRGWGKSSPGTRPSPTRQVAPLTDCLRGAQGLFLTQSSQSPRRGLRRNRSGRSAVLGGRIADSQRFCGFGTMK